MSVRDLAVVLPDVLRRFQGLTDLGESRALLREAFPLLDALSRSGVGSREVAAALGSLGTEAHLAGDFTEASVLALRRVLGDSRVADLLTNHPAVAETALAGADLLEFLAGEIARPVDIPASMQTAAGLGGNLFIEAGPKSTLTGSVAAALGAMTPQPGPIRAAYVATAADLESVLAPPAGPAPAAPAGDGP